MRTIHALGEARERFRHAFEETPVGMALIDVRPDTRGQFLQVNQALCHLTGYSAAELGELRFAALVHRDYASDIDRAWDGVLVGGELSFEKETLIITRSGAPVWGLVHGSLVRDTDGRALYEVAHLQDVSARKAAEEQLEHLALHDALAGLPNRVLSADQLGKALDVAGRY